MTSQVAAPAHRRKSTPCKRRERHLSLQRFRKHRLRNEPVPNIGQYTGAAPIFEFVPLAGSSERRMGRPALISETELLLKDDESSGFDAFLPFTPAEQGNAAGLDRYRQHPLFLQWCRTSSSV
jgi:hypothetical protein